MECRMKSVFSVLILILFIVNPNLQAKSDSVNSKPTAITFNSSLPNKGNIALGVYENGNLEHFANELNNSTDGGLSYAIQASDFEGKVNTSKVITAPRNSGYQQILLVGLGSKEKPNSNLVWQEIGGNALQAGLKAFKQAPVMAFNLSPEATANIAFGAKLGSYFFDKYYTKAERKKTQKAIMFINLKHAETKQHFQQELDPVANAIWHTRDISNEPANIIYPESFISEWKKHFKGFKNVKIKVLDVKDMLKLDMGAIYGVGRGSKRPPRVMIVEYMAGNKNQKPVVVVGKGITFDSGGISIKNPPNMWNMKFDMSGAASAIGTIHALAGRNAKVNAVAIAALAENMPGANAQRPGDVVKSMSGKTIQIRSTDAEGRLVLADGIYYGDSQYDPSLLVDLATLTGSASRALGKDYAALFSRHDELVGKLIEMGKITGEEVWHLPLNKNHFKAIENDVADIMNSGPTAPGASAGAAFIGTFVRDTTQWVHLDIAGVAWNDKATAMKSSPGSTSFGIRLLNGYIKAYFEK